MLKPKLFTVLKDYSKEQFINDVTAGIIVAIVAIPLSIALAIASGVSPEKGLHTAIIAGFLISFLGGSRVQIGGPTGAFVVIVFGILSQYGIDGLILATIMAGIILVIMGLLKLGSLIKFIPYPITTGFTSGIALTIFSTQIKDFLGLRIDSVPSEFLAKYSSYFKNIHTLNYSSLLIGLISLAIIILWPKINKKIPGSLIALIAATVITAVFNLNIETIGSRFGEISSALPKFSVPDVSLSRIKELLNPAITIALLAAIESLLSAVVADGMIGGKHRSNMELVAQGVANIGSGLFGGIPATGAIARTATNIKNGGRTPIAGIVHAIVILFVMVIFMPYAKLIPLSSLAAILIVVSYNMSEWRAFKNLMKAPKSDVAVLLITFFLTVMVDLVVAIEVGMVLAAFLFMKRMADVTNVKQLTDESYEDDNNDENELLNVDALSKYVSIYEIDGPFFFGAAEKFTEVMNEIREKPKVLIIRMRNVPAMDATAFYAFTKVYENCKMNNIKLILSSVQEQPFKVMDSYNFIERIGKDSICSNLDESIKKAKKLIENNGIILNSGNITKQQTANEF
ncbi:SulP family inorganic anion transporter [Brassicibacter mesophilus]|uniref:SulP family inorganic anion transporter n=1 Tax=Brassicibacter mesophilus TaxID=745119 RepID=UPI003D1F8987